MKVSSYCKTSSNHTRIQKRAFKNQKTWMSCPIAWGDGKNIKVIEVLCVICAPVTDIAKVT